MSTLPSIAIIGAGSMGGAILSGLLSPAVTVDGGIRVTNRTAAKAALVELGVIDHAAVRLPLVESEEAELARVRAGLAVVGLA